MTAADELAVDEIPEADAAIVTATGEAGGRTGGSELDYRSHPVVVGVGLLGYPFARYWIPGTKTAVGAARSQPETVPVVDDAQSADWTLVCVDHRVAGLDDERSVDPPAGGTLLEIPQPDDAVVPACGEHSAFGCFDDCQSAYLHRRVVLVEPKMVFRVGDIPDLDPTGRVADRDEHRVTDLACGNGPDEGVPV